jgi:uncharacterized protein (DUF433 family)
VSDPAVLCAKPVIRGTRLAVEFLLGWFAEGWTTAQVLASYPELKPADLQALFAYSSECVREEEFVTTHAPSLALGEGLLRGFFIVLERDGFRRRPLR